jgi:hypothetical protein
MSILDLYAGAEELDLAAGGEGVVDAVEEVVRAEVAEIAVVVEEQSQAIENLAEEVASMDDAVEELAENVDGMESLLNSGNFNSLAFAKLYNRGVVLANKLGADIGGERMGAESISDASTAQMIARQGMEGFMDTVKEYGKKAIEFIKHIFNTVINFFVSIFNQADGLQRRVEQLKKRLDGGAALKDTIKLGGWNVYFDYAKKGLPSAETPVSLEGTKGALIEFVALGNNVSGITLDSFKSAYNKLVGAIKADAKKMGRANEKKAGNTNVIIAIEAGIRIRAQYNDMDPKDLGDAAAAARSIKLSVVKDPEAKKMTSGDAKAKLKKTELHAVLTHALKEIGKLRQLGIAKKFSAAERDRVIGSLNAVKAGDADKSAEVNKQVNLVRAVTAIGASLTQSAIKETASEIRAMLDGVQAHMGFGNVSDTTK